MKQPTLKLIGPGLAAFPFCVISILGQSSLRTAKIPDGTALRLSLSESLSSATNSVDDPVHFEVTEDVKVVDTVMIPKGATAVGHVVEVEPRRRMGRAGKLNFTIDHVKAPDGSNVRLRASTTRKGDDKTGTVIVGTVLLSPLFLIMRGKDINVPKGTVIAAYVDGDREIALSVPSAAVPANASVAQVQSVVEQKAAVSFRSTPDGAEVSIDGKYSGSTPSTLQLATGEHTVSVTMPGFKTWQRSVTVSGGSNVTMSAILEKK